MRRGKVYHQDLLVARPPFIRFALIKGFCADVIDCLQSIHKKYYGKEI